MLTTYMFREFQPQVRQNQSPLGERGGSLQQRQVMSAKPRSQSGPFNDFRNF